MILIEITDNGLGIEEDLIPVLLTGESVSIGKENGNGLGVSHAIKYLKSINGKLSIKSKVGEGTSVLISIPFIETPSWFVSDLKIKEKHIFIICDDDPSIHHIWEEKFSELEGSKVKLIHLYSISQLIEYANKNIKKNINKYRYTLLCDFEFIADKKNGLEIIILLEIQSISVLVTNLYDDIHIIEKCKK